MPYWLHLPLIMRAGVCEKYYNPIIIHLSICRQAFYDERTQLISQLFQRLSVGHAANEADTEASSDEDGLAQVVLIRKGLLLVIRLMPLLNQVIFVLKVLG